MFCHQCGTSLPEGARFCPSCGTEQILLPEEPSPVQKQANTIKGPSIQDKIKEKASNFKEKASETKKSFDKARNESGSNNKKSNFQKKKVNWSAKEFTIPIPDWLKKFWSKCRTLPDYAKEKVTIAIDWLRPRFFPFCRKAGKSLLSLIQIILGLLLFLLAFVWEALKDFWAKFRTWPLQKQRIFAGCGAAVLVVCVVVGGMNRSSRSTPDYSSGSSYNSSSFSSGSSGTTSSGSSSFSGSSSSSSNSSSISSSSSSSSSSGGTTGWFESKGGNPVPCPNCDSSGDVDCSACGGSGGKYVYDNSTPNYAGSSVSKSSRTWEVCSKCHGSKKQKCRTCGGDHEL